jgi:hypothetical protein
MPKHWRRGTTIDTNEISSPRVLSIKEKIRIATTSKVVKFATDTDDGLQRMLDSQALLAQNLDPTTFGAAIALAVTIAMTASTSTIRAEVSTGISAAMTNVLIPALQARIPTIAAKAPKLSGTVPVTKRGALGPNESIADFISELPKTSGKIPRLGAWNENVLPRCVKERYDTARDPNSLLTSKLINTPYVYKADDGSTDLTAGGGRDTHRTYLSNILASLYVTCNH